jgi:hypothetical protein
MDEETEEFNSVFLPEDGLTVENSTIGRILRANTAGFAVGCRVSQLSEPSFGSLVKAQPVEEREAIYGLIYDMHIDDDPLVRRLVMAEDPRPSVIEDQRNNRLLPVEMSVLTIGYRLGGTLYHGLPPRPPLNLDPVYLCRESAEVREFTEDRGYLRLILRAAADKVPVDQLLVAHIRQIYLLRGEDSDWVNHMIQEVIELLRSDYDLLVPVLEALNSSMRELGVGGRGLASGDV